MTAATRNHRATRGKDGAVDLLAAILFGSADLHGAACTGLGRLFDPDVTAAAVGFATDKARHDAIAQTCRGCPVRGQCWAWATRLHPDRVSGPTAGTVSVAGVMNGRGPRRPRRAATAQSIPEDPETALARPGPPRRRGARSRVRPSIHRHR